MESFNVLKTIKLEQILPIFQHFHLITESFFSYSFLFSYSCSLCKLLVFYAPTLIQCFKFQTARDRQSSPLEVLRDNVSFRFRAIFKYFLARDLFSFFLPGGATTFFLLSGTSSTFLKGAACSSKVIELTPINTGLHNTILRFQLGFIPTHESLSPQHSTAR